jgi:hypothetical protein
MASTIGFGATKQKVAESRASDALHGSTGALVSGMTTSVQHLADPVATGAYPPVNRLYPQSQGQSNQGGMMATTAQTFDKLVSALGSASKHDSRSVIDALMLWRKAQNTAIDAETVRRNMYSLF